MEFVAFVASNSPLVFAFQYFCKRSNLEHGCFMVLSWLVMDGHGMCVTLVLPPRSKTWIDLVHMTSHAFLTIILIIHSHPMVQIAFFETHGHNYCVSLVQGIRYS